MKGDSAHHYLLYVKKVKLGNGIVTSWWSRASLRGLHLNRDLEDVKDGSLKNAVDEDQGRADSQCKKPSLQIKGWKENQDNEAIRTLNRVVEGEVRKVGMGQVT